MLYLIRGNDGQVRSACVLKDKSEQVHSLKHLFPLEIKDTSVTSNAEFVEENEPFFCPTWSVENDGSLR